MQRRKYYKITIMVNKKQVVIKRTPRAVLEKISKTIIKNK